MTAEHDDFQQQLPVLLRLLADPTTPHTALELWSRIRGFGWAECVPTLMAELESGEADVKRLIADILNEEVNQFGPDSVHGFVPLIVSLLSDDDRLVRISAISTVRNMRIGGQEATNLLRRIICSDEPILAQEALIALLELDSAVIEEVRQYFRD